MEIHNSKKMIKLKIVFEEVMVNYRAPCLPREKDGALLPIAVTDSYSDKAQQPFEPCKRSNFVIFVDRDWPLLSEVSLLVSTGVF